MDSGKYLKMITDDDGIMSSELQCKWELTQYSVQWSPTAFGVLQSHMELRSVFDTGLVIYIV